MSTCLSDIRIQEAADGRATPSEEGHLRTCAACSRRVEAAREDVAAFGRAMASAPVPPSLERRVSGAVARAAASPPPRGATTLAPARRPVWTRPAWVTAAGALVAATVLLVFVLPSLHVAPAELSAAQILDRSIAALAPGGTERLEYDLAVGAPPGWPIEAGTYRIEQIVDHDGGRWRVSRFGPDGTLLNGMSENPESRRRHAYVRIDGQGYAFDFTTAPGSAMRLADVQRSYGEAAIRIVQGASASLVTTVETGGPRRFVIELPEGARATTGAPALLWDVTSARVVVDAGDYHVVELAVRGVYMGEPVSVSYALRQRDVRATPQVAPDEFELPPDPAAIHLAAEGSAHPPRDLVTTLLREVGRTRR